MSLIERKSIDEAYEKIKCKRGYKKHDIVPRGEVLSMLLEAIDCAPTVDAEPVRHGHWIHTGITNIYGGHQHECSVCGYSLIVSPLCDNENYCCSCGAKMDEVTE